MNWNFSRPVKAVRFQQGKRKIQNTNNMALFYSFTYLQTECKKKFCFRFCSSSVHRSIASPSIGCFCLPFSTNNRCFVRRPHLLKEGLFFDSSCPQISQETNCCNFWQKKHAKNIYKVIRKGSFPVFHDFFILNGSVFFNRFS